MGRRLVVTVCPREPGVVVLPVERGRRAVRLDAPAIARHLQALVVGRRLEDRVRVRAACAGGCHGPGPNVDVAAFPLPPPGEPPDHVAIARKTYVYSLPTLDRLATVIDENLTAPPVGGARAGRRRAR